MDDILRTASTGYFPMEVSPESITTSVPSRTAFATSVTSARVGTGLSVIDSSIWVAVITIFRARFAPWCGACASSNRFQERGEGSWRGSGGTPNPRTPADPKTNCVGAVCPIGLGDRPVEWVPCGAWGIPSAGFWVDQEVPRPMFTGTSRIILASFFFSAFPALHADGVRITELCADNRSGLLAQDKGASECVEIYTPGPGDANLEGFTLTDNGKKPDKWTFPAVTIAPSRFLVVFCSGKDRTDPASELHTNFKLKH